jgi:hypothetical protein
MPNWICLLCTKRLLFSGKLLIHTVLCINYLHIVLLDVLLFLSSVGQLMIVQQVNISTCSTHAGRTVQSRLFYLAWACAAFIVPPSSTQPPTPPPTTTVAGPIILPAYSKCNGVTNAVCVAGTGCFRSNSLYAECRPFCPATWACETDFAGPNEQCAGML